MELWLFFLILSILLAAFGVVRLKTKSTAAGEGRFRKSINRSPTPLHQYRSGAPREPASNFDHPLAGEDLPDQPIEFEIWDQRSITQQLEQLRGQPPSVIAHYIESVKTRFALNQNDKTAAVRSNFLKTQVEELKLFKEGKQAMTDLEALGLEREKRLKTLQLENAQLDDSMRTRSEEETLQALKRRKQIELEIAQIEKQMVDLNAPLAPPPKREPELTAEQRKAQEKNACEVRIAELKTQRQLALKIDDEDERMRKVNAIDGALEREYERWAKLI